MATESTFPPGHRRPLSGPPELFPDGVDLSELEPSDSEGPTHNHQPRQSSHIHPPPTRDAHTSDIPWGAREIGGLPVPEQLRFDPSFMEKTHEEKVMVLRFLNESQHRLVPPPRKLSCVQKTVPLYEGQAEALDRFISDAKDNPEDRRRNLTRNNLIRVLIQVFLSQIAPYMDVREVASEHALQEEMVRGLKAYSNNLGTLPNLGLNR